LTSINLSEDLGGNGLEKKVMTKNEADPLRTRGQAGDGS